MENSELVGELLQELVKDVNRLQESINQLSRQSPPDYRGSIDALSQAVQTWQQQMGSMPSTIDQSPVLERLARLEQSVRQRPEYKLSQYVRYGGYVFGLMVILLVTMTWLGLGWKSERDTVEQAYGEANWRVRYTQQANPDYYSYMEGVFAKDPVGVSKWIVDQEQADEKRALAQKAAQQAKALSDQANQLEGKSRTTGKTKERP